MLNGSIVKGARSERNPRAGWKLVTGDWKLV
jgi:hypothetical protein